MILEGFYNEETLIELLQDNQISHLEFVLHHSPERKQLFENFCEERNLHADEEAALQFSQHLVELEENGDL